MNLSVKICDVRPKRGLRESKDVPESMRSKKTTEKRKKNVKKEREIDDILSKIKVCLLEETKTVYYIFY